MATEVTVLLTAVDELYVISLYYFCCVDFNFDHAVHGTNWPTSPLPRKLLGLD